MRFQFEPDHHGVTNEQLIEELRRVAQDAPNGTKITQAYYDLCGKYAACTYVRRFGGWLNALKAAGLEATRRYRVSDDELFQNLETLWEQLGRQPYTSECVPPLSQFGPDPYKRRFGSWQQALRAFVEVANSDADEVERDSISSVAQGTSRRTPRQPGWRLRFLVMRRDSFKCSNCGRSPSTHTGLVLHVDHVVPWSKGGETVEDNLQTLCEECNIGKGELSDTT
jgi:hypothetical protein